MKKNQLKWTAIIAVIALGITSCKENTPTPSNPPENETELITTVRLVFTDTSNQTVRVASFSDIDGPGGNAPTIFDTIKLQPNKVYKTKIYLLDETKNPVDSISNQVLTEGADHLFVFTKTGVNLLFNMTDADKNNLPIGLSSLWTAGANSFGSVTVVLRHQPGVKDGTVNPGETDVEIVFPCKIE
ncbi:MAG: hypothetical protein PSX81_08050 [bacterium]|nr:hypothetical protein [bacterium]